MASLLSPNERSVLAVDLAQWSMVTNRDAITRSYQFKDFKEAFAFMTQCALMAEQMNHHPEWFNVWNRVEVTLSTHDAGGLTKLDLDLARSMDRYANTLLAK
ncbi:4a-hydroxytetrahydrobiopterin dehydratase [Polynucleobacter sp. MWH-UH24A]|jgi:4a-hydroxytetrahydrobiopterin dehydratase|uniref:4a-hydroxytetrahydrobiopterin dehydratase n=1 Tax=Polynucleobacter sp. MWH-UH24A TaxID=2689110 RepID=UPI001BFD1E30|nr:4a-hydroxytetrahydrobiopterin dehydratase [Polynucleobacter sp. MWH-UH24A]NCV77838.1 4a-hydroxytetrahydrobiopterin dehydratase [Burkholderiaceae bacterium]QWD75254.1 4a-hydroxytetrahydrobiopterin dehydratase [Polynucleobacter sp. MWH-UH24A]